MRHFFVRIAAAKHILRTPNQAQLSTITTSTTRHLYNKPQVAFGGGEIGGCVGGGNGGVIGEWAGVGISQEWQVEGGVGVGGWLGGWEGFLWLN